MSEYEDQSDDADSICPYCKNTYQSEDYDHTERKETCGECCKTFITHQEFEVTS